MVGGVEGEPSCSSCCSKGVGIGSKIIRSDIRVPLKRAKSRHRCDASAIHHSPPATRLEYPRDERITGFKNRSFQTLRVSELSASVVRGPPIAGSIVGALEDVWLPFFDPGEKENVHNSLGQQRVSRIIQKGFADGIMQHMIDISRMADFEAFRIFLIVELVAREGCYPGFGVSITLLDRVATVGATYLLGLRAT